ncbi:hypothetical protein FJ661_19795 [Pseudarthrobacter phenanthrenivorans]|uniref:hypothetical protein n=1 Tax=Pseudarthrobacter phenanthrenivorans TaxID=361575 RepID=UPI00112B1B74|nr:hypothetical protein [Pseudarthrobacter phenanthrenivorans]TPV48008.1 hypothetical protein FJ661_19795 [Pseudarthrobacter phenanthrenivorans]
MAEMLVLDEVDTKTWFRQLGISETVHSDVQHQVAHLFVEVVAPQAERAAIVAERYPKRPRPGTFSLTIERTNLYVRVKDLSQVRASVFAGIMAALLSGSIPAGALTGIATQLWDKVGTFDDQELEMIAKIRRLNSGGSPYSSWLTMDQIVSSYPMEEEPVVIRLMASMKTKGHLEEAAGLWRIRL